MFSNNNKISMRQFQCLLILDIFGMSVITMPREVSIISGRSGWIAVLCAGIIMTFYTIVLTTLSEKYQNDTFVEFSQKILGGFLGKLLSICFAIKIILTSALQLRFFCEIIRQIVLFLTPLWLTSAIVILVCTYAAYIGYECRGKIAEILLVLIFIPFIFVFALAALDIDFSNLFPIIAENVETLPAGIFVILFMFGGLEFILFARPYINGGKNYKKEIFKVTALLCFLFTITTILTIAKFGNSVSHKLFPVLQIMDTVSIPGSFLERQDILIIWFAIVSIFAAINAGIYFTTVIFSRLTKNEEKRRRWLWLVVPAIFIISLLPSDMAQSYEIMKKILLYLGGIFLFIIPILLFILSELNGKKKVLSLFLLCFLITGCADKVEMEDRSFIITLGIDMGKDDSLNLTLGEIKSLEEGEKPSIEANGRTFSSAIKNADMMNDKQIYLGQLKTVVLGKELLENEGLTKEVLTALERNQTVNKKIVVLASNDTASDILKAISEKNTSSGLYIWDYYNVAGDKSASTEKVDLETLLQNVRDYDGIVIPKVSLTDEGVKIGGGMVISNYIFRGELSDLEERGYLWLKNKAAGASIDGVFQGENITLGVSKDKCKFLFSEKDGKIICDVYIDVIGSLEGGGMEQDSFFDSSTLREIEKIFEKIITTEVENTMSIASIEYKTDVFGLTRELEKQNINIYKKYNGKDSFENMIFKIRTDVNIKGIGVIE